MKKNLVVLGAVALSAAAAVPALALENEFHGMYRAYGYVSNAHTGGGTFNLKTDGKDRTNSYMEQRARLQYIAKASDDLKLVTHFELDSLFGGQNGSKYTNTTDSGSLDADGVTLETKNVYLDFNIPSAPVNVKLGVQPYADAYMGTFGNFDGAGAYATGKFGAFTPSVGWFRVNEDKNLAYPIGKLTTDLITADVKFAVNKDVTVGANYIYMGNDGRTGNSTVADAALPNAEKVHTFGLNASAKVGPAALNAFAAYQFGDYKDATNQELSAYAGAVTAKIKAGPGNVNLAALYLSGDDTAPAANHKQEGWQSLASNGTTSYFNAANTWLLIRNGAGINTSASIGTNDLTKGGRGLMGFFAGYEGSAGKVFYAANAGYAQTAEERGNEDGAIGTEVNATVGYKLYDNMSASINYAHAFLGKGMNSTTASERIPGGASDAADPYAAFVRIDYAF